MKLEQIDPFVSLATSIPPEDRVERHAYTQLASLAPPPHGAPASLASVRGLLTCIESALLTIPSPSAHALTIKDSFVALQSELEGTLAATGAAEPLGGVDRTKTRHPEWHFFVRMGSKKHLHRLASLYVGLKSLLAIRAEKALSKSTIDHAEKLLKENDLTGVQVHALLHGTSPEQILGQSWPRDLCRTWRDVMRHFCMDGDPPPASTKERIAAQILDAALHATTGVRAGARSHRQFSKSQLCKTFARVGVAQDQDTLLGALAVLVCVTTFSVDVVAELPLKSGSLDGSWLAEVDVQSGAVTVDYGFVAHEASAPISGAIPSSYICTRPLPTALADRLRVRLARYPDARALNELFPDETVPAHDSLVFPCTDQIQPTWARLRRSVGTYLRESGVDNLLASVVSGDLTHVPRSKLYYACVTAEEMYGAFQTFYHLAGWSEPTRLSPQSLAFGCQVVPTLEALITLDRYWQTRVHGSHPGKHSSVEKLIEFHNAFMCWTGMRLSLLLALRETSELSVSADIDELRDRWIPTHDKNVPGDNSALPVPLTTWVKLTIQSVRAHCKAMQSRLRTMGLKDCDLARWCAAVVGRASVPLLCLAIAPSAIRPLATSDFIGKDLKHLVPPDFGRKAMENLARAFGLRAAEIDATLRHTAPGQTTNCATSDTAPLVRWQRANEAISAIAISIFTDVGYGLAKE